MKKVIAHRYFLCFAAVVLLALSGCNPTKGGTAAPAATTSAKSTPTTAATPAATAASVGPVTATIFEQDDLRVRYGLQDGRLTFFSDEDPATLLLQLDLSGETDPVAVAKSARFQDWDDDGYGDLTLTLSSGGVVVYPWDRLLGTISPRPYAAQGLWLTMGAWPRDTVLENYEDEDDAGAKTVWAVKDGRMLCFAQVEAAKPGADAVRASMAELFDMDESAITLTQDAALSARLSYPSYRFAFAREDSDLDYDMEGAYVQTDGWDYFLLIGTPVAPGLGDAITVQDMVDSLTLVQTPVVTAKGAMSFLARTLMPLTFDTDGLDILSADEEYALDGMLYFSLESHDAIGADEEDVRSLIASLEGDVVDLLCARDEEMATRLTYPVWRVYYIAGENEDSRACRDVVVLTDGAAYRLHTRVPLDGDDIYLEEAERRILSLDFH